ncbi:MAG: zeta toxin family protein [Bacteroidia bacterium]
MSDFIVIGGPNGAGKSTIFPAINSVSREPGSFEPEIIPPDNFVNADNIAKEFNIDEIAAARITLDRVNQLLEEKKSIAIESTLSGKWLLNTIKNARLNGYRIYIFYIIVESAELSMTRVTQRALLGKHYIPLNNVLLRYQRSVHNFFKLYKPLADFWVISNNSHILTKPLTWGGKIFNSEEYFAQNIEDFKTLIEIINFNKIDFSIDDSLLNLNDTFTPIVIRNVKDIVESELANRPSGNYISVSENFKIKFIRFAP